MMKIRWNRKGFTLAEVLIVVAIIVVLAGVGFVALFSHMRTMHQLEVDGHAKEIFVAAQNHLTLTDSQGYLGKTNATAFGTVADADSDIYYFLVGGDDGANLDDKDSILSQMLPFGSVDESARAGGSYIIRYQKSSATILDVFYVSTSGRFSLEDQGDLDYSGAMALAGDDDEHKKARRDNYKGGKTVLGWYGGAEAAALLKGEPLIAPGLQVLNGDKLEVIVTDNNTDSKNTGNQLNLIITGTFKETAEENPQVVISLADASNGVYTITLDDVTTAGEQFYSKLNALLPAGTGESKKFVPGENIDIKAVAFNNTLITNIAESSTVRTNSLFESVSDSTGSNTTANISSLRHLLNLSTSVSGIKNDNLYLTVEYAQQTADLKWTDFTTNTGNDAIVGISKSTTTGFLPVDPVSTLKEYDGKDFKISDIVVSYNDVAGLFGTINGCNVKDLELVDFVIGTTGSAAGALAGSVSGSTISGILVHNRGMGGTDSGKSISVTEGSGSAGGLVGSMTGGSVQACAAAVYVKSEAGNAGGLIGTASGGSVDSSYAGGHTQGAKYLTEVGDTTAARVNVIGGASAGGLIGSATGTNITNSYTTASAKGATPGGFIGTRSGGTIDNVYASGLVISSAADGKPYPFIGNGNDGQTDITNASYLLGVTTVVLNDQSSVSGITPVSSGMSDTAFTPATKAAAVVYDPALGVQYAFKTVAQLGGVSKAGITDRHYGDWQLPSLTDLDYVLKNNDPVTMPTLYTQIKLESTTQYITLALQGETSKNVRLFVLQVVRNASNIVTGVTVKSESGVDNADSSKNWQRNNTTESPNTCTALPIALPATGSATPTITVTLDSITDAGGHFAQLFAADDTDAKLIPGENFTLYVRGGEGVWEEAKNLKREEEEAAADKFGYFNPYAKVDNSLFAFAFEKKKGGAYISGTTLADAINHGESNDVTKAAYNTAPPTQIAEFRHLQNLDYTVSGVDDGVKKAILFDNKNPTRKSLNWETAKTSYATIVNTAGKAVTDSFSGIYTKALTEFDGNGWTISNLVVDGSKMEDGFTTTGQGSAGLFRYVATKATVKDPDGLTIKNLDLIKPIITAGTNGNAGVVAAEVATDASLKIDTVFALPIMPERDSGSPELPIPAEMTVSASGGAAGGFVGLNKGALNVNNSAAALLVNGGTAAGGLVGNSESSVTLINSFVSGHTLNGAYSDSEWNVTSSGAAGGLIGKMAGTASITHTFSTASVKGGAGKAGGLVGEVSGSFTALDYAYTVAPVEGVKALSLGESNSNGALIGSTNSNIANGHVFFLPDVYEDPLTESGTNNVTLLGTGGKNFTNTDKVHAADIYNRKEPTIMGLTVSDTGATVIDDLEMQTQTYDSTLAGKEYPFKISTRYKEELMFFGDWAPPKNSGSSQFTIHFLIQTLEQDGESNPPVDFIMDTGVAGAAISSTTIYAQLDPFSGAQVTVPTMPYKPGYNYGTNEGILSLANVYTDSNPLAETAMACVWQVYIGNQTTTLKGGGTVSSGETGARYSRNGGTIELTEEDLRAAYDLHAANPSEEEALTLVAYYYKLKDQYSFTLMDYDPKTVEGLPDESKYGQWGNLQFVNQPGFNSESGEGSGTSLYYKNVYNGNGTPAGAFNAALGNLIIPKLNVKGYTFLGWYDGTGSDAAQVFSCVNGVLKLETPNTEIKNNVKLYARYRQNEQSEITLSFVLEQGTQSIPLSIEYTLEFDKSLGFDQDIDLPGFEKGVNGLKVVSYASATDTEGTVVLDVNGTPATSSVAWFNRLKVKDENGNEVEKDTDRSVHINTGVRDSYPYKYTVYYHGNVDMVGVVVMHELDHTSYYNNAANPVYTYDTGTYYEKYAETLVIEGTQPPIESSYYPAHPLDKETLIGFKQPGPEQIFAYPYNAENAAKYGVSESSVSGKNIAWIIVVPYAREQYEMRFVNLGMSQGEDKFQWKMPYVGESLEAYLPATSDYSPRLYGDNYKFKSWQYEYTDGTVINQAPTEMPDHDLVLRAQYEGQPVDYTVLIWVENPDPDKNADGSVVTNPDGTPKYSYTQVGRKVITKGAYPDEVINVNPATGSDFSVGTAQISAQTIGIAGIVDKTVDGKTVKLSDYIEYDHSDTDVHADGRGTTKINVYYNRKSYVLRFDVGFSVPASGSSSYDYEVIENYEGGDAYGLVGSSYVLLTKIGESWYYTDNTNGAYFGKEGSTYIPLRYEDVSSEVYKAAHKYQSTEEDGDIRFGVDTSGGHGEFKQLIVDKITEGEALPEKTVYLLTNTVSAGNEYLIVSRNSSGTGYALTYTTSGNNATPGAQKITVLAATERIDAPYIESDGINAKTKWTTSGSTKFSNKSGNTTYYVRRSSSDLVITNNNSSNTWSWNGNNNRLSQTSGGFFSTTYYLRYNSGSFSLSTSTSSIYLYVKTTIPAMQPPTTYHYYLSEEDKLNNREYDGTLYIEQNNNQNGAAYEYTTDDLVQRNGEFYYLDTTGVYGRADTYILTEYVRTDTTPTYYKISDGSKYTGTVYRFTEYTGDLYQQIETTPQRYYVSQVSDSRYYENFLSTSTSNSIEVGTTNPFIKTTSKVYSKNCYHGSYKEVKSGTTYTVYYWDIVAKYGANIIANWPDGFDAQNGNRFIGWLSDNRSYYRWYVTDGTIKDRVDTMAEKYILNSENSSNKNGPYTAKSVKMNADGTYTYGNDDVAHEFICRYHTTQQTYVYRYYFYDPDEGDYPAFEEPDLERVVYSQEGYTIKAKVGDFDGYYQAERWALGSYNINNKKNPDVERQYWTYNIPLALTPGTSVTGTVMLFYFKPLQYDIHFEYTGDLSGPITGVGANGVVANVDNKKTISEYAYTSIGLSSEYSWDGDWYDNEDPNYDGDPFFKNGDTDFNETRTMPNGELTLYARVVHKPVTITLELGTPDEGETITMSGDSVNSLAWQDPVSSLLLEDNGSFKEAFTPVRTAPQNAVYHWNFLGWTTKQTGATKDDEYVYAQPQMTSITLYPIWEQADNAKAATVHIVYQYYDDEVKDYVTIPNLPASVKTEYTHHPNNPDKEIVVGDYFSLVAPNLEEYGYTAIDASVGPLQVNEESITIPIKYRQTAWFITVNYYVQFTSVTPEGWMTTDTDEHITAGSSPKTAMPVTTATVAANSEYFLMGYTAPDVDWLKDYRFDHFEFGDYTTYSNYVTVHPDATTNKATVDVYLTPDTDNIMIPDLVCPYIGKSYANYSKGNPIEVDSSVGNCEIHYVFYDADGKRLSDAEVVNAGAYGMRAYITVETGGGTYLIWQSVGDDPPLHMYIQRRVVILYSAIATDTYGDDKVLEDPTVYYRPFTSTMLASDNEAKAKIARYYDPSDEAHYLGLQDYVSDNNPGNAGFVNGDDQYFEWEFSASAFRREKGISYNIFTYKVTAAGKELGMEDNYYFYVCFGTLTVN